ncbi:WD40 repeat-like protein, partial [Ascobolus immersus RN42]
DDPLRAYMPASFGKDIKQERDLTVEYEKTRRGGPLLPKKKEEPKKEQQTGQGGDSDDDSGSGFESSDDEEEEDDLPITHEITLKPHEKAISHISLDPSGTRFITSSHDYFVRLFDFPAMSTNSLHAFRAIEPQSAHHIHASLFSPLDSGQNILVLPAYTQAKLYSRHGEELCEFVKGDMYLRDMNNTKGHVSEITAGCWHPSNAALFATASCDSTVRIWDVNNHRKQRNVIVHKSKTSKGGRSKMCCVAWAPAVGDLGKNMIASVALDGSLVLFAGDGPYTRPQMEVRNAHTPETWTTGIAFSNDGRLLVTRGGQDDNTIKVWDTRKLKTPINTRTNFPTSHHAENNIIFSPDNSSLLAGDADGNLHLMSPASLISQKTLPITPGHPLVTVTWHPKLNQILTGSSTGALHILYSPTHSTKGAKTIISNAPKRHHIDDSLTTDLSAGFSGDSVLLPNAILASSSSDNARASQKSKRIDPLRPTMPPITPWGKSQPDAEHIKNSIALSSMRDEDPREALLKYAEKAEKDPMFTRAYRETQPTTIYAEVGEEE